MIIKVAKSAGFCVGIERALKIVNGQLEKGKNVYTLGPITHNEQVCGELEEKGVRIINDVSEADEIKDSIIIIRSHGVPEETYNRLKRTEETNGNLIVDATCGFVKRIHKIVSEKSAEGMNVIITGDSEHPEVKGICGWCKGPCYVINSPEEAMNYPGDRSKKTIIVSQTTFNSRKFEVLVEILGKMLYDVTVAKSICNSTETRQQETYELAKNSDAMIVIGGKNSSNTTKLYEISAKECKNTYHIQTPDDLDLNDFKSFRCVGITAGASTPKTIIEEVQEICQSLTRCLKNQ